MLRWFFYRLYYRSPFGSVRGKVYLAAWRLCSWVSHTVYDLTHRRWWVRYDRGIAFGFSDHTGTTGLWISPRHFGLRSDHLLEWARWDWPIVRVEKDDIPFYKPTVIRRWGPFVYTNMDTTRGFVEAVSLFGIKIR